MAHDKLFQVGDAEISSKEATKSDDLVQCSYFQRYPGPAKLDNLSFATLKKFRLFPLIIIILYNFLESSSNSNGMRERKPTKSVEIMSAAKLDMKNNCYLKIT